MAGIYIHVPFCKQACHYCNFYFSTSPGNKQKFVQALLHEIQLAKNYLEEEEIETIYFGGGTPTQLTTADIQIITEEIFRHYPCKQLKEFTIEANPDDLTQSRIEELSSIKSYGFNRFSIGVQSFFEEDLKYMNRAHTAEEALASVKRVQDAGFENITLDLIYGTPTMNDEHWLQNLEVAFALGVPHISSYALTVENKTSLENRIQKGVSVPVDEEQTARQFTILMRELRKNNFEQYEISNFAKAGKYALHNTNYWFGKKYLGLGPSAHSFNGKTRIWNVANNISYIHALNEGKILYEEEFLTQAQKANEKIMTALRTQWGLNISAFESSISDLIKQQLESVNPNYYVFSGDILKLTEQGKLFADGVAAQLFIDED
jgi:oxygen-independent coproporphyrinogen-3 oxidase